MTENTAARTLAGSSGKVIEITGLALNTVSTLYLMKYLTTAGTGVVEYLPLLFNNSSNTTFREHMGNVVSVSLFSLLSVFLILAFGILIRRVGTWISADETITSLEGFLYGHKHTRDMNAEFTGNTGRTRGRPVD